MKLIIDWKIWNVLLVTFAALSIISFVSFFYPSFGNLIYILIIVATLVISLKNISIGLLILLSELIIGSQGHLLDLHLGPISISLRIGLWLIILSVWSYFFIKQPSNFFKKIKHNKHFIKPYFILFIFVIWGILLGIIKQHDFANIFFDMNGWLYFSLVFPWLYFDKKYLKYIWTIFTAGVTWIFVKSTLLLYIFSHNFENIIPNVYLWIRDFRIGEITYVSGNFWRVFMQHQSMALVLLLFIIGWLWYNSKSVKQTIFKNFQVWIFGIISLIIVLLSYSRSFWLGMVLTLISFFVYLIISKDLSWKKIFSTLYLSGGAAIIALLFIMITINFPIPYVPLDSSNLISSRLSGGATEAAGGSRLALLQPLLIKVNESFFFGDGYGSTITYRSLDPRIIAQSPGKTGEYTTYAFEWGYLDIWLKIGVIGLLAYLYLLASLFKKGLINNRVHLPILLSLAGLVFTNITTPYLNHPLGIGLIILASYIIFNYETT